MLHPYITPCSGKDPGKGEFSIMHSYFETLGKYLLFSKFLTSTNMPTDQQQKGHKIKPYLPGIGGWAGIKMASAFKLNKSYCTIMTLTMTAGKSVSLIPRLSSRQAEGEIGIRYQL